MSRSGFFIHFANWNYVSRDVFNRTPFFIYMYRVWRKREKNAFLRCRFGFHSIFVCRTQSFTHIYSGTCNLWFLFLSFVLFHQWFYSILMFFSSYLTFLWRFHMVWRVLIWCNVAIIITTVQRRTHFNLDFIDLLSHALRTFVWSVASSKWGDSKMNFKSSAIFRTLLSNTLNLLDTPKCYYFFSFGFFSAQVKGRKKHMV